MKSSSRRRVVGGACVALWLSTVSGCSPSPKAAVSPAPVAAASSASPSSPAPGAFGPATIDAALRAEWRRRDVTPSAPADDATFLRRVTVDLIGTIPTEAEAKAFLESRDPDKRAKWVDRLLASPEYAEHWALYWDDELMGRRTTGAVVDRDAFRSWLRGRIADNTPWDRLVTEIVSATGVNSQGGPRAKGRGPVLDVAEPDAEDGDERVAVNGAVNWTLRFADAPQDVAGTASRVFLGVQIQCAQCHDHKTEKWKTEDFRKLTAAFWHVNSKPLDRGKPMKSIKRVEVVDTPRVPPRFAKNPENAPIARSAPVALDGTALEAAGGKTSVRAALAAWMTSANNPWFARAAVNRMWGHFLGRGFYDPIDDMRASNAPTMPELLDAVAADFAKGGFDMRRLMRTICLTEAYGLSARPSAKPDGSNAAWAKFRLVPLGREELLRALLRATDAEEAARRANLDVDRLRASLVRQYGFLFDVDEDSDAVDYAGTVTQALMLINGAFVGHASRALPGSALGEVLSRPGDDASKVAALYLRVLTRAPTAEETTRAVDYVTHASHVAKPAKGGGAQKGQGPLGRLGRKAGPPDARRDAWEDLTWSLLNSSEFLFNH
ncbi:MAG: DUF1549 domain-containing protein [Myxococcales bacterium]|nr:DUF1549 domain-containing protein [Myxococcales bacterium]